MGSLTQSGTADWATVGTHTGVTTTTDGNGVGLTVDVVTDASGGVPAVTVNGAGIGYTQCFLNNEDPFGSELASKECTIT